MVSERSFYTMFPTPIVFSAARNRVDFASRNRLATMLFLVTSLLTSVTPMDAQEKQPPANPVDANTTQAVASIPQLYNKGKLQHLQANFDEAITLYLEALKLLLKVRGEQHPAVATIYNDLGRACRGKGAYEKAIQYHEKALSIYRKTVGPEHLFAATASVNLGKAHDAKGAYDEAIECYEQGLLIFLKILGPEHAHVATSYNNLGAAHDAKGAYDKAIECYEKSLATRLKTLDSGHPKIATSYNNLGAAHEAKGAYDKAVGYYKESLAIQLKTLGPDHHDVAISYNNLGVVLGAKGAYDKALEYYEKSLTILLKTLGPDHLDVASSYNNLGTVYGEIGDFDSAIEHHEQALTIYLKKLGSGHPNVAVSYANLALDYADKGRYDKVVAYYEKALTILLASFGSGHPRVATIYNNLGGAYADKGEYQKAIEYYGQALAIYLQTVGPRHHLLATTYNNLGLAYKKKGDYDMAIDYYGKALAIYFKTLDPAHPAVAIGYGNLGGAHDGNGDHDEAIGCHVKSLAIFLKAHGERHATVATAYGNLGWACHAKGKYDEAIGCHEKSLAIKLETLGPEHPATATAYGNLGWAYDAKGKYDKAIDYYEKSLSILIKVYGMEHPRVAGAYSLLGLVNDTNGEPHKALQFAMLANKSRERFVTLIFSYLLPAQRLDFQRRYYPFDLLGRLDDGPALARAALRHKGIVLDSLLEDRALEKRSVDPDFRELLEEREALAGKWAKLGQSASGSESRQAAESMVRRREELSAQIEELEKRIMRAPGGENRARRALKVTVTGVSEVLWQGDVLVEFLKYRHWKSKGRKGGESRYGAVLIGPGDTVFGDDQEGEPIWVPLGPADVIEEAVGKYRSLKRGRVSKARLEKLTEVNAKLGHLLFTPIEKKLPKGTKTLIVSPDGVLNFVSFASLQGADGKFLAERFGFRYVASGRDLAYGAESNKQGKGIVIFANPDFNRSGKPIAKEEESQAFAMRSIDLKNLMKGSSLQPLPGSEKEASALRKLADERKVPAKVYLGSDATEERLTAVASPHVLHLATHGYFMNEPEGSRKEPEPLSGLVRPDSNRPTSILSNPMDRSFLAFSGAKKTFEAWGEERFPPPGGDGVLTAREAGMLDLDGTWLVTLSACDTGSGDATSGEGVMGLRRGFVKAGARNLLFTLWPTEDKTTAGLMTDFYKRALANQDAPGTLEQVQLEWLLRLRKEWTPKLGEEAAAGLAARLAGPFVLSFQGSAE
jgi:tetratricopeptide (TPR) repeat protein/CHAT domain-containing protein